ncbi:PAS domain-containing sensor histidine kinase [uncultured Alistipes sp.]|jgi:nitrogen fixation/metabolism regulation signal transduction histidine kinase|uniref:sensor histidine kinase n=1 Tax=uncultured Alistipes sp. TaxID=538949 RepID=UPI0025FDA2FA|nr:ATP-binding protein [uncultured Alistipes sp.]
MKNDGISYGPLVEQLVLLVLATAGLGAILASGFYIFSILFVPLVGLCIYRIIRRYGESIRRVTFMFNAIDNDDLTFRFRDDEAEADNRMLNTALNRIKEIIVRAKLRAEERERYYQLIMECARTGLVTVNDAGSVYQANGEALRIFGLPRMTHIRQTETSMPEACRALQEIRTGQRLHVKEMTEAGEVNLSLTCAEIMLDQKRLRVIAVSDIDDYLAQTQIESWSKLTRILTHEIMNSLAPITSLSDTLLHLGRPLDTDVAQGLETISATSRRLTAFVETFRRFTRIPEPQKAPVEVRGLLERAAALVATPQVGITVDVQPAEMLVYADEGLVSQVVVNLLKNAREAVAAQPDARIDVRARIDEGENIRIDVTDNGKAIPAAVTENIFTPFFTTKADGSGIGLSVSRRIMQLHNGSLRLTSNTDRRVTFTLLFE